MAVTVIFGIWNVTSTSAKQTWSITPFSGTVIARVYADFLKDGVLETTSNSTMLSGEGEVDVTDFTGEVKLVLRLCDANNNLVHTAESAVAVSNRDATPPSAPSYLNHFDQTPNGIKLRWGASIDNRGVDFYRIYNTKDGVRKLLATVAAPSTTASISVDTRTLSRITVTAVDAMGNESMDSPPVNIHQDPVGPRITFFNWNVNRITAGITWEIYDRSFVTEVTYTIQTDQEIIGPLQGFTIGSASIGVAGYKGPVTVTVEAVNAAGERSVAESSITVHNKPPLPPKVTYAELSPDSVKIILIPRLNDVTIAGYTLLYGKGVVEFGPYTERVVPVDPGSRETFYARSYTPDQVQSPLSEPLVLNVPLTPGGGVPKPNQPPGNPLAHLGALMTPEIKAFLVQLFTDTRRRDSHAPQVYDFPEGFDLLLDYFMLIAGNFGAIIRRELGDDQESYLTSELIDKTPDPIQKLAIWAERLEYDFIYNLGG